MKTKRNFLIKQSLMKKINTKWFKAVNIILFILIVALANIDKIINQFGGDFEKESKIIVVDETNSYESFKLYYEEIGKSLGDLNRYTITKAEMQNLDQLKEDLENEDNQSNVIVKITIDEAEYLKSELISYDPVDTINLQLISATLNAIKSEYALENSGIDSNELAKIISPMSINQVTTNPDLEENAQAKDIVSSVVLILFVVPFFILVVMLVQMLGAEINDEKSSRSMEIIISNVSPRTHFASKIVAAMGFVLTQALLFVIYGGVGILVRYLLNGGLGFSSGSEIGDSVSQVIELLRNTGILASLAQVIPLIILLLGLNLLAFAILAGVLASMTTSIEDYQQLQSPLMILLMFGYYLGVMASVFEGAVFIKVFSYLPFFSTMIAPVLYLLGQTTIFELLISTGVIAITCYVLFRYGLRVYKVGILNYSSKDLWKKIFKSIRNQV